VYPLLKTAYPPTSPTRLNTHQSILSAAHPATGPIAGHRNTAHAVAYNASRIVLSVAKLSVLHFANATSKTATKRTKRRKRDKKKKPLVEKVVRGDAVDTVNSTVVGDGRRMRRCGGWVSMALAAELDALVGGRCARITDPYEYGDALL
jgi:hypothetical protein